MNPPVSPETPPTLNGPSSNEAATSYSDMLVRSSQYLANNTQRLPNTFRFGSNGEPKPPHQHQWDDSGSQSPASKRRRFNAQFSLKTNMPRHPELPHPRPSCTPHLDGSQFRDNMFLYPSQPHHNIKERLPYDPSLKLPPLQNSTASPGIITPVTPSSQQSGSSLESIVMAVPVLNKIKLLAKISPPLALPLWDGTSPRGPVISVEGQNPVLAKTMFDYLNSVLQKEGKYNVQTFEGPDIGPRKPSSESLMDDAIVDYLNTVSAWHPISNGIRRFVRPSTGSLVLEPAKEDVHSGVSSKIITPEITNLLGSPTQSSVNNFVTSQSTAVSGPAIPLALVLRYQLTTADAYACSVPIHDLYKPLDHWQWMASLWRACVGPDITVYIRECEKEELEHLGGNPVEVHLREPRVVVVRKAGCEGFEDKVLRRVGFEIEDFLTQ